MADGRDWCGAQAPSPLQDIFFLILAAENTVDLQGFIAGVDFYRDANADGLLDVLADEYLGPGYPLAEYCEAGSCRAWLFDAVARSVAGSEIYFAQATDNDGNKSNLVSTSVDFIEASVTVMADLELALATIEWDTPIRVKRSK